MARVERNLPDAVADARHELALACAEWATGPHGLGETDAFAVYAECYPFFLRHIDDADDLATWERKDFRDILFLVRRVL